MPKFPKKKPLILKLIRSWEIWIILIIAFLGIVLAIPRGENVSDLSEERNLLENFLQQEPAKVSSEQVKALVEKTEENQSYPDLISQKINHFCNNKIDAIKEVFEETNIQRLAATTNYGNREKFDRTPEKRSVPHQPVMVVLHETVIPLNETLKLFETNQENDSAQVSYHVVVGLTGDRYRVVPDDKRAFGAGNSEFKGLSVSLNPALPSSVNNIALHVSLETPPDGNREIPEHSGYTEEQYQSLASVVGNWMIFYKIPIKFITTHKAVDRDGNKKDPRSFDQSKFQNYLNIYLERVSSDVCPA
ncbi:peptidoglycan recognition family protein [Synechococcus elongatus]|uniref:N-acetylmuramoyl-L-alanine amidase n=1 Tax=Synechococcus elongatus TaxID=32046 RepID=UPI0030D2F64B